MIRSRWQLAAALAAVLGAACGMGDLDGVDAGGDGEDEGASTARLRADYYVHGDGRIRTPDRTFASLREWYASPEFQRTPRCGTRETPRGSGRGFTVGPTNPMASPGHCTMSFTDIEGEYHITQSNLVIPVVFHNIVRADMTGFVSTEQILSQIEILNEDFGALPGTPGYGGPKSENVNIRFVIAGINRVQNDAWFNLPITHEAAYKSQLAWNPHRYLNVYTVGVPEDGALGWATFPQLDAGDPAADGVVLMFDTVGRDGSNPPYDQGRTATHEVGHYLGLLHTFAPNDGSTGVCTNGWGSGDLIQDTPAQSAPTFGCPAQATSCGLNQPSIAGNVHNYMNYTDDACMHYFTIQQKNRATCSLINYRPQLYTTVPATYTIHNGGRTEGTMHGSIINLPKAPVPAGTVMRLGAMTNVPANQAVPPTNVELRLGRKVGDTLQNLASSQSNGLTPAQISYQVTQTASHWWTVVRAGGGTPAPHTFYAIYLNCATEEGAGHPACP